MSENAVALIINKYIQNETTEDELVQIIGGNIEAVSANYKTQRLSASKYSYMPLWTTFTEQTKINIANEIVKDIEENTPKIIMVCKENNDESEFYKLIQDKEEWDKFLKDKYIKESLLPKQYSVYKRK